MKKGARLAPLLLCWALFLLGGAVLRGLLYRGYHEASAPLTSLLAALLRGSLLDSAAALTLFLPLGLWLLLLPERTFRRPLHRGALKAVLAACGAALVFLFVSEYFFFAEFDSRFNHIALDYLLFPYEVFINIWEVYPVGKAAAGALLFGALFACADRSQEPGPARGKAALGLACAAGALLLLAARLGPLAASEDRVLTQVSSNGLYGLAYAALTHHLDMPAFYRALPRQEAFERARKVLGQSGAAFAPGEGSTQRGVPGDPKRAPLNVVLILIESFGSEFSAVYGGASPSYTPNLDALAGEGLAFRRIYASGNRTVRGLEGVLASFLPLPGDAIVKRDRSENVSTIARVLKDRGYETLFLYGGRGVFDGMRAFATDNGFDRFIEQKDFSDPKFTTVWGVSDEDIFDRTLEELRALHAAKKPFLTAVLTVSNHKPYTYPKGRIDLDPAARSRQHAVKYTDWALGRFLRQAQKEPFYKDTVFAVVADHGARVYGSQSIPLHSYEIPLLVLAPGVRPAAIDTLGCSLDVAPTVLGLLGRPYQSVFFGADLLKLAKGGGRVFTHHNRDIGMMRDGRLAVLGLNKTLEFYRLDPATRQLSLKRVPDNADRELGRDAAALFQVADELYTERRYRVQ